MLGAVDYGFRGKLFLALNNSRLALNNSFLALSNSFLALNNRLAYCLALKTSI